MIQNIQNPPAGLAGRLLQMVLHSYSASKNCLILLGASNLTLSLRLVIDLMQLRLGVPSEVLSSVERCVKKIQPHIKFDSVYVKQ
jgi:hypothetical protein